MLYFQGLQLKIQGLFKYFQGSHLLQCFDTVGWVSSLQKIERLGAGVVICPQRGANNLHMMPLPPNHLLLHQNIEWFLPFW